MAKITLPRITSLTNQESAIQLFNTWAESIEEALELTLSRNGQTPNAMNATLDLNNNRIINMAAPVDDNDPVRLIDVVDGIKGDTGDTGPPGSVADGDKGDIIVSGSGAIWSFDPGVVTTAARTILDDASTAAIRTTLGLAGAALLDTGTVAGTVATGDDTRFDRYAISTQNTDYTFPVVTGPTLFLHTSATPHAWTINPVATTAYPVGTAFTIHNTFGTGAITLTRGAGVSLYINGSTTSANGTIAAGGAVNVIQTASDNWIAIGPGIA